MEDGAAALRQRHSSDPAEWHQHDAERCAVGWRLLWAAPLSGTQEESTGSTTPRIGASWSTITTPRTSHIRASRLDPLTASAPPSSTSCSSAANIAGSMSGGLLMWALASVPAFPHVEVRR